MEIAKRTNSLFNSVCYRIAGGEGCGARGHLLVDPGDEWEGFQGVRAVLLTHAHFDHIYGLNRVLELNPQALVYTNDAGREMLADARKNMSYYHETPFVFDHPESVRLVGDGDRLNLGDGGGTMVEARFTPGHNPSCITWVTDDCVFSGDSLIPGIKTVTNLPKCNKAQAAESEALIKALMQGRHIYPGHQV